MVRKDGTDAVTGLMGNKLDNAIRQADALYARSDSMESGRWDAERDLGGEATMADAGEYTLSKESNHWLVTSPMGIKTKIDSKAKALAYIENKKKPHVPFKGQGT